MVQIKKKEKNSIKNNTFVIKILYQRNISWQGEIKWLEGQKKINFRSLLELINLMQEILKETEEPEVECSIRSWKPK